MANDGRIYSEKLDDSTSAANGPYYITNDLNYDDTEMLSSTENNAGNQSGPGSNAGSGTSGPEKKEIVGMSLYYSHALRLLFYTYPNGKSYVGTLEDISGAYPLNKAVLITNKANNTGKSTNLGLCQWLEVIGHPGLLFAMGKGKTLNNCFAPSDLQFKINKFQMEHLMQC